MGQVLGRRGGTHFQTPSAALTGSYFYIYNFVPVEFLWMYHVWRGSCFSDNYPRVPTLLITKSTFTHIGHIFMSHVHLALFLDFLFCSTGLSIHILYSSPRPCDGL